MNKETRIVVTNFLIDIKKDVDRFFQGTCDGSEVRSLVINLPYFDKARYLNGQKIRDFFNRVDWEWIAQKYYS